MERSQKVGAIRRAGKDEFQIGKGDCGIDVHVRGIYRTRQSEQFNSANAQYAGSV